MTINYAFAPTSLNSLFNAEMPSTFSRIHSYILYRMQLPEWKLCKKDIAIRLNKSMSTVKRAFKWLQEHGYLKHDPINKWQVYPSPNLSKGVINEPLMRVNNEPLYIKESLQKKEQQQPVVTTRPTPKTIEIIHVVVSSESEGLVFPVQLTTPQLKEAKVKIKKVPVDMQQAVLTVLAHCLTQGTVKAPVAYLNGLITRANNGTLDPIQAAGASISNQVSIAKTLEMLDSYRAVKKTKPDGAFNGLRSALRSAG